MIGYLRNPGLQLSLEIFLELFCIIKGDFIRVNDSLIDEQDGDVVKEERVIFLGMLGGIDEHFDAVLYLAVEVEEGYGEEDGDEVEDVQGED